MTEITPEALEALSKKATQGTWEVETDPYGAPFPGIVHPGSLFEFADFSVGESGDENQANAEFVCALVNLFRAGQLVHAVPSEEEMEAVARAICGASGDVWRTGEGMRSPFAAQADRVNNHWRFKATAAITALDAARGKQ